MTPAAATERLFPRLSIAGLLVRYSGTLDVHA